LGVNVLDIMLDSLKDTFVMRTPNRPRDNGINGANICNKFST